MRYSPEFKRQLRQCYLQQPSTVELAERFFMPRRTVYEICKDLIEVRRAKLTEDQKRQIKELLGYGLSPSRTAQRVRVSATTVRRYR